VEEPVGVVACCFVLLAFQAAPDEVYNSHVHFWPPEVAANQLDRLVLAHMTSDLRVVF